MAHSQYVSDHLAKFVILFASSILSATALADGIGSSGGGAGIFCPAVVVNQPPVQILDTYEGQIMDGFKYTESADPYEHQLQALIKHRLAFDFTIQFEFKENLDSIRANTNFLPAGVGIHVPSDLGNEMVPVPTGCHLGGIGFYQNEKLYVSTDAFSQMSETQKAAFFAHEAFYRLRRLINPETTQSTRARKMVAAVFSDNATAQQLYETSRYLNWSLGTVGPWKKGWTVAPGAEKYFQYSGYWNAAYVDRKPMFIELKSQGQPQGQAPWMTLEIRNPRGGRCLYIQKEGLIQVNTAKLPDDCRVMYVSASSWYRADLFINHIQFMSFDPASQGENYARIRYYFR